MSAKINPERANAENLSPVLLIKRHEIVAKEASTTHEEVR